MRNSLLVILCFFPLWLMGQCSITAIEWGQTVYCNEATDKMVIPINVVFTGTVDTIRVSVTGLDYAFNHKHFTNTGANELTFMVYQSADGQTHNYNAIVDLIGGSCSATVTDNEPYVLNAPNGCTPNSCQEILTLDGTVTNTGEIFEASNLINSTQVFEPNSQATIGATNAVILNPGFHAKSGSDLLINNVGCTN